MACLQRFGFGDEWRSASTGGRSIDDWGTEVRASVRADLNASEQAAITSSPSLSLFARLLSLRQDTMSVPLYLSDYSNIAGSRLKTRLRLGCALLMPRIANYLGWPKRGGTCMLCGTAIEDTVHFLAICPSLRYCRARFMRELQGLLRFGTPGAFLLVKASRCVNSPQEFTELLLADGASTFPPSLATENYSNYCALSRWFLDRATKNCISAMWKCRAACVGSFTAVSGSMYHVPPSTGSLRLCLAAQNQDCSPVPIPPRSSWRPWTSPRRNQGTILWTRRARAPLRNFFVVWRGWKTGIFYQWRDCKRAIRGFPQAQFQGFETLAEAEEASVTANAA